MRLHALVLPLALGFTAAPILHAQATYEIAPSGRGRTEVTLAPRPTPGAQRGERATIALDYGQPHLRGRALHTESLVPYDVPWRTGANTATTLTTGVDLLLGGVEVARGTYFVYTLPTRTTWTLILQRDAGQEPTEYDAANDVARIPLRRRALSTPVESLTMWLIPSTGDGQARGELRILWGNSEVATDWVVR